MKAEGYAWLEYPDSAQMTFIKVDVSLTSAVALGNDHLKECVCREIETRYHGTVIKTRTRIIVADPIRNQPAFHCAEHRVPVPYELMMGREAEDALLEGIHAGLWPCQMPAVLSAVTTSEHWGFFFHVFGGGAYSWCLPCQTLLEEWRALKLAREEWRQYSYFLFDSRLEVA